MGVHKKPGMNTSGATVDCGFIFLWKGSQRGSSSASLSQDRFEGHRQLSSYIKQEIQASKIQESPTHERVWRRLRIFYFPPMATRRHETDALEQKGRISNDTSINC